MSENTSTITMDDSQGFHMYQKDGKSYPSVTTILGVVSYNKFIVRWANRLGFQHKDYEEALKQTADEGTLMHAGAQALVDPEHGAMPVIKDALTEYYVRQRLDGLRLKLKFHEGNWSTIFTESPFVSDTYGIGGTLDWYSMWYGKKTLFDFKSSSGLRDKHLLQLGGYDLILQDNGITIDQAGIILVKRDNCIINIFDRPIINELAKYFLTVKQYYYESKRTTEIVSASAEIL